MLTFLFLRRQLFQPDHWNATNATFRKCLTHAGHPNRLPRGHIDLPIETLLPGGPDRKTSRLVPITNLHEHLPEDLDSKPICVLTVHREVQSESVTA